MHGTNSSSPSTSSTVWPMRVMIRIDTATYGESVICTPMWAIGDPSGPIENGTTYIVRPRIEPLNRPRSVSFISAGSCQLFVGPASSTRSEQMKVRSSTRATSPGSESARWELGRFASLRRSNVPASTSSCAIRSYSSAEPSHQWIDSGWVSSATSSTQSSSFLLVVGALVVSIVTAGSTSLIGKGDPGTLSYRDEPQCKFEQPAG